MRNRDWPEFNRRFCRTEKKRSHRPHKNATQNLRRQKGITDAGRVLGGRRKIKWLNHKQEGEEEGNLREVSSTKGNAGSQKKIVRYSQIGGRKAGC